MIYLDLDAQVDMELIEEREHGENIENAIVYDALHSFSNFIYSSCPPLTQMDPIQHLEPF